MIISEKLLLLTEDTRKFYLLRKELYDLLQWSYDTLFLDDLLNSNILNNDIHIILYEYFIINFESNTYKTFITKINKFVMDYGIAFEKNDIINNINMVNIIFRFNDAELWLCDNKFNLKFIIQSLLKDCNFTETELNIIKNWFYIKTNQAITIKTSDDIPSVPISSF